MKRKKESPSLNITKGSRSVFEPLGEDLNFSSSNFGSCSLRRKTSFRDTERLLNMMGINKRNELPFDKIRSYKIEREETLKWPALNEASISHTSQRV